MADRRGFTLLEMLVALMVGGVLAAVAVRAFGGVQGGLAVGSARATFLSYHAQTRAIAVERGALIRLSVNPETQVVSIQVGCDGAGEVLESRNFADSYSVSLNTGGGVVGLCMTPKGVASPNLNTFGNQADIVFERGENASSVRLLPLGQAVTL